MKCPVCLKEMLEQDFGSAKIDVCKDGCKGIWFDWSELSELDEESEGLGNELKDALNYPRSNDENRGQIYCPKCGIPLHVHRYRNSKEINIDECYKCGGFFLDSGELKVIRDSSMSEQECKEYAQKLIAGNPMYQKAQMDLEKKELRNKAIRRFSRILMTRYYYPLE